MSQLKNMLIRHEGLKLKPYRCTAGKLTIGVGRNLDDKGITVDEAIYMLDADLKEAEMDLIKYDWFNSLSDIRKDVLRDMYINLGLTRLLGFKNMIEALKVRNYQRAAMEMLDSKWANQVGNRAKELAKMMESDNYVT